jgi:hypothetical protein
VVTTSRPSRLRAAAWILIVAVGVTLPATLGTASMSSAGRSGVEAAQERSQPTAPAKIPTIEEKTARMQKIDGFFPMYWDEAAGTLWLEIPKLDTEVLYITGLPAGIGSNDIGLDRGQLGGTRIVKFQRVGQRVLMVQPNYRFRATAGSPDERRAVEDSFATSILWGFTVAAETGGHLLVDTTDFILRDVHNVIGRLRPATFRLDRSRCAVYMPRTRAFPKNTEMEVTLTFVADGSTAGAGGGFERGSLNYVAPSADSVTVREHHSLVELPEANFTPRKFDPRSGFGDFSYEDYSAPLGEPLTKQFIRRHRLAKKDPAAKISEPVKPIVYYLDRGAPEPIRSALLEGIRWWNQAFEAAGYKNAFQAELMPEGADPMDVRYNVVQWVHRSTRGWSYGGGVTDPRTGEIIQGHVTLGSLRVRQDYMIAEGLLTPYRNGNETPAEVKEMALARMRQLAAHEVGHAIGFGHQYYDSSKGYISVMDYPQPLATLGPDGTVDLSKAYGVGIGEWDKVAVTWGYQNFPPGTDEDKALEKIIDDAWDKDLRYLSNQDADYNPRVDQWALGTNPAVELDRMMKTRRAVLNRFGENAIKAGRPQALIEEPLVPVYLYHRYQVEAAASTLGGLYYFYTLRGDGHEPARAVPAAEQRAALEALMRTLAPSELVLPATILKVLPPRPDGFDRHRELFPRNTGLPFDALTPGVVASDLTVSFILRPDRAARIVQQHALDPSLPGLEEVVDRLVKAGFDAKVANPYEAEVLRGVARVIVDRLIMLAATAPMPQVRAIAADRLETLRNRLKKATATAVAIEGASAHYRLLTADITRFLERPAGPYRQPALPGAPPGAPIGDPGIEWLPPYGTGTFWWSWWEQEASTLSSAYGLWPPSGAR